MSKIIRINFHFYVLSHFSALIELRFFCTFRIRSNYFSTTTRSKVKTGILSIFIVFYGSFFVNHTLENSQNHFFGLYIQVWVSSSDQMTDVGNFPESGKILQNTVKISKKSVKVGIKLKNTKK